VAILKDFVFAVLREWKVWLAESAVMIALAVTLLVKPDIAPLPAWLWFVLVFVVGLLVASFKAFKAARMAQLTAEESLRPKIKASFGEHIPGCVVATSITGTDIQAKWVRIKVEADNAGGDVADCSVTLVGLSRNNQTIFDNESIALNMARSTPPRADLKDLRDQVPEFGDVIGITSQNQIGIAIPNDGRGIPNHIANQGNIFGPSGDYIFKLIVSAPTTGSVTRYIRMHWDGDWRTVRLYSI
jgi:hypothetical protein